MEAVFLNPVEPKAMRHHIRSARLKGWQAMLRKHGGDMKAAVKEWRAHRASVLGSRRGAAATGGRRAIGALAGLTASRAANPKGGVQMAARTRSRRRRNKYEFPPSPAWIEKWRAGMAKAGRTPKRGPKFRKIKTEADWKKRYRGHLAARLSAASHRGKSGVRAARRRFGRRIMSGVRATPMLLNPFSSERWMRRTMSATGFRPHVRGAMPGTTRWWRAVGAGVQAKGSSAYYRGVVGKGKKWQSGILSAVRREIRDTLARRAANPIKRRRKTMTKRHPLMRYARRRRNDPGRLYKNDPDRRRSHRARRHSRRSARRHARRMGLPTYPLALLNDPGRLMRNDPDRGRRRRSRRSRMNPLGDNVKALVTKDAASKYLYVVGGATAGGILPGLLVGGLKKLGLFKEGTTPFTEAAIGVVASGLAGVAVGAITKSDEKGILVAAGGLGGVLGALLVGWLKPTLGLSGLGADAEMALKQAVASEMAKMGLTGSMGQFLLPGESQELSGGMGQFLTQPEMEADVASTQGLGIAEDLSAEGSDAFGGLDGSVF